MDGVAYHGWAAFLLEFLFNCTIDGGKKSSHVLVRGCIYIAYVLITRTSYYLDELDQNSY